jgi:phage gp37-like protein
MGTVSWTLVEDEAVAALTSQLGAAVKTVGSYQGDWRRALREETWRLPAVLVVLTRSRAEQVGAASFDLTLDFQVLVVVRQLRGEAAGRREAGGAYELLAGVREALWHRDLGLEATPLALIREEPLLNDGEFTVYAAHYRTSAVQDR